MGQTISQQTETTKENSFCGVEKSGDNFKLNLGNLETKIFDAVVTSEAEWLAAMESDTVAKIMVTTSVYFQNNPTINVGNIYKEIYTVESRIRTGGVYNFQTGARFYCTLGTVGPTLVFNLNSNTVFAETIQYGSPTGFEVNDGNFYYEALSTPGSAVIGGTGNATQLFWNNTNKTTVTADTVLVKNGFPLEDDSVISVNESTRIFTIGPSSGSFKFYIQGTEYEKSANQNIEWPDTEGRHFFYFDSSGNIATTDVFDYDLVLKYTYIAFIHWDATNKVANLFINQRHTTEITGRQIQSDDLITGADWSSGLALTDILADESGNDDTHAQFGVTEGVIVDSDIITSITSKGSTLGFEAFYLDGSGNVRSDIQKAGFSVFTDIDAGIGSTGRLVYNDWNDSVNPLKVVPNNDYVLCHVLAIQQVDDSKRVFAIVGNSEYSTLENARTGADTEMGQIVDQFSIGIGGDVIPLGTVIFQTSNTDLNAVKARIVSYDTVSDYIDFRRPTGTGAAASSGTTAFPTPINIISVSSVQNTAMLLYKATGATKPVFNWNGSGSPSDTMWDNADVDPYVSNGGRIRSITVACAGAAVQESSVAAECFTRVEVWKIQTSAEGGPVLLDSVDVPMQPNANIEVFNNLGSVPGISGTALADISVPAGTLFGVIARASSQFSGGNSYINAWRNTAISLNMY